MKVTSPDGSTIQQPADVKHLLMADVAEIRIDLRLERSVKMPVDVVSLWQSIQLLQLVIQQIDALFSQTVDVAGHIFPVTSSM